MGNAMKKEDYSGFAKLLHWAVALCVLFMIPAGITMNLLGPGKLQDSLYDLHRSCGVLVLALMLIRLANRLVAGAPPPEPSLSTFQRKASHAVHMSLYPLLIVQAVLGWVATSAYGAPVIFFGLFRLPDLVAKNEPLSDKLFLAHNLTGFTIAALLIVHIGAALHHRFVLRDGVLQRMLP
jgi:cytochrome b561